jgi:hypothetical protein
MSLADAEHSAKRRIQPAHNRRIAVDKCRKVLVEQSPDVFRRELCGGGRILFFSITFLTGFVVLEYGM